MGWSWRIARIAGIDVYMHFTFLLLLAWVGASYYFRRGDIAEAIGGLVFILLLFAIVVMHEFGHALAARRYGIGTRDITLLPIGGVARLERMPTDPWQELVVAIAGPLVNVALAAGCYLLIALRGGLSSGFYAMDPQVPLLDKLFVVNVSLVIFNMLPAFPMDGGRVLRAFLAMHMDYVQATQIAAMIGQGMALLFGFLGLFTFANPILIFIALFVWMGAAQEASMVQMRAALDGIPVQRAMITYFHVLSPSETLAKAIEFVLAGFQQDFPVVDGEAVVGVLTRSDLAAALAQQGTTARVGDVMQRKFAVVHPHEMLHVALSRLQECNCHTLPVVKDGRLVGLMTTDNLTEVLMIQEALRAGRPGAAQMTVPTQGSLQQALPKEQRPQLPA